MAHFSLPHAALRMLFLFPLLGMLLIATGSATAAVASPPGDFQGCPEPGQGGDPDLNRLKNRSAPVETPQAMTVAQINALPLPLEALHGKRATWPAGTLSEISAVEQKGAVVEGFLIGAKQSGPETTNCKRQELRDYHLWIVDTQGQTKAQAVVTEPTPRWLAVTDSSSARPTTRKGETHRLADVRYGSSGPDGQDPRRAVGNSSPHHD